VEKLVRSKQVQEITNTHLHEHAYFSHGKVAFIHRVSRIFRAPRKRFSWTSPVSVAFENGQALHFFQTSPFKIHFTKSQLHGFTRKQNPIW